MLSSKTISLALATTAAAAASAGTARTASGSPVYTTTQLQASDRSGNTLNMPAGATINSSTGLALGNGKHVAFKLQTSGSYPNDALWYGQNASGGSIAMSSSIISMNSSGMSAAGKLIFTVSGSYSTAQGTKSKGLWTYDGATFTSLATADSSWGNPTIQNNGNTAGSNVTTTGTTRVLRQYSLTGGSNSDFATGTTTNLLGGAYAAGGNYFAVRNGSSQVVRYASGIGTPTVMSTGYTGIGNSTYDVTGGGSVAFYGSAGGVTQLVVTPDGTNFSQVAAVGSGFTSLDSNFAPVINENGWVAFEGTPTGGTKGVYVFDGSGPTTRVVGVGDLIALANNTTATISSLNSSFDLNDNGDVLFSVGYTGGGRGVYVASVPEPGTAALTLVAVGGFAASRRQRRRGTGL